MSLSTPLLEEREASSSKAFSTLKLRRSLAVISALLPLVFVYLMITQRSLFVSKHFQVTKDVSDVLLVSMFQSSVCVWLCFWFQDDLTSGDVFTNKYLSFIYWQEFCCLVLLVSKCIAFEEYDQINSTVIVMAGVVTAFQFLISSRMWNLRNAEAARRSDLETGAKVHVQGVMLMSIMKPYFFPKGLINKLRCILTWACLLLSKAANLLSPLYIGSAVQHLSMDNVDLDEVYKDVVTYAGLSLCSKMFKELQNVSYMGVKQTAYAEIAVRVFTHLHGLSLDWHLAKKLGSVLRGMDRGVNAANNLVTYLFMYLLPSVAECCIVFYIFYKHFKIPTLSAVAFLAFAMYTTLTVQITLWRKKFREKTNRHDNDYHDKATDSVINYETVKYFTNEKYEIDRYAKSVKQFQKHSINTQASLSLLNTIQQLIIQSCVAVSLCIAAYQVVNGMDKEEFKVGDFVSVNVYIIQLFAPLGFLGTVYNVIIQSLVDMGNLSELLSASPDIVDKRKAKELLIKDVNKGAKIEFKNVSFHYPKQTRNTGIKGLSFCAEAGTTTAVVGHTGAGKTTVSRLIFRFYDVRHGSVKIDDQDVRDVKQISLRKQIGVVPQDTVLFNDTIRYNLMYGKVTASESELLSACKRAQILDFIENLPEKFDTIVGERGLKLSGGEKQRIAIARCLLKAPPIVVLDEATSSLDSLTERDVQESLQELTESRTTVVIAHRLSTVRNADLIVVLKAGVKIEHGTHEELLQLKGEYYDMWIAQSKSTDTSQK